MNTPEPTVPPFGKVNFTVTMAHAGGGIATTIGQADAFLARVAWHLLMRDTWPTDEELAKLKVEDIFANGSE